MKRLLLRHGIPVAAIALCIFVAQLKLIVGDFELMGDARVMLYPKWVYLEKCLRHGVYPLWNPYELFGTPLASNPQTMSAHPLLLAVTLLAGWTVRTLAWWFFIISGIAGVGFYVMCTVYGLRRLPAAIGGIAFALCGIFSGGVFHIMYIQPFAWFPWAVAAWRWARKRRGGGPHGLVAPFVLYAVAMALAVLGGYPLVVWFMALGSILLPLLEAAVARTRLLAFDLAFHASGWTAAALLSAVYLLPLAADGPNFGRSRNAQPYSTALGSMAFAPRALITTLAPGLNLLPEPPEVQWDYTQTLGYHPTFRDLHLGILPLFLIPAAFGGRRPRRLLGMAGLGVAGLFLAFGIHSVPREWLYYLVPFGDRSRNTGLFRFLLLFAACFLATHGLQRLLAAPGRQRQARFAQRRRSRRFLQAAAVLGAAWIGALCWSFASQQGPPLGRAPWNILADEMVVGAILLALLGGLLAVRSRIGEPAFRTAASCLVLLSVLDQYHRALALSLGIEALPRTVRGPLVQDAAAARMPDYAEFRRHWGQALPPEPSPIFRGNERRMHSENPLHSLALFESRPYIDGYEAWTPIRSDHYGRWGPAAAEGALLGSRIFRPYLSWVCPESPPDTPAVVNYQQVAILRSQDCPGAGPPATAGLLRPPIRLGIHGFEGIAQEASTDTEFRGKTTARSGYLETEALRPPVPGARAVLSVELRVDAEATASILSTEAGGQAFQVRQDFRPRVGRPATRYHVDLGAAAGKVRILPAQVRGAGFVLRSVEVSWSEPARIENPVMEPNRLSARVVLPRDGLVVITSAYLPGWTATLDGAETPLHRAFGAFSAVRVGQGAHELALEYRPASFKAGLGISLSTLALLAAALLLVRGRPDVGAGARTAGQRGERPERPRGARADSTRETISPVDTVPREE